MGLDATIRYGKKDLRMKNSSLYPLYVFTVINDKSLTIMIKGEKNLQNSYEVYTEEDDINLPFASDENKAVKPGISIYVYRKKMHGNTVVQNSLLYKDFYPPVNVER